MPLVGGEHFFDGFGFEKYAQEFDWRHSPTDERERRCPPKRPLLSFLATLNRQLPSRWSTSQGKGVMAGSALLWRGQPLF